jgi:hypothetical protein
MMQFPFVGLACPVNPCGKLQWHRLPGKPTGDQSGRPDFP